MKNNSSTLPYASALDGFRGIAILLVLLCHCPLAIPPTISTNIWNLFSSVGWIGVDMFFVLSGFLITSILTQNKNQPHYYVNFYFRRALRIMPAYFLYLIFFTVLVPQSPTLREAFGPIGRSPLWYWFYAANFVIARDGYLLGPMDLTWSLAIEEQFYILWPFIVAATTPRSLRKVCALLFALSFCARVGQMWTGGNLVANYVSLFTRLDGLAVGSAIGSYAAEYELTTTVIRWAKRLLLVSLFFIAAGFSTGTQATNPLVQIVVYPAAAILFGSLLILVKQERSRWSKPFSWKPLRILGKYSYGLYLIHLPWMLYVETVLLKSFFAIGRPLLTTLVIDLGLILSSLAIASLSYHLYEVHFLKLKNFFTAGNGYSDKALPFDDGNSFGDSVEPPVVPKAQDGTLPSF